MQALEVRRVPTSADLEKPGDFVFIAKRPPLVHTEKVPTLTDGLFRSILRKFLKINRYEEKQTFEPIWPDRDTVIILCPNCIQPFGTTILHTIVSLEPLTISPEVACPYCRTKSFCIEEGKIIPVVFHAA